MVAYEDEQAVQVDLYDGTASECEGAKQCVWLTVLDAQAQPVCGFVPSAEAFAGLMADVDMLGLSVHGKTLAERCKEYDEDNPATGWDAVLCPIQQTVSNFYEWLYDQ
ncbi:MAG: hypothetical protein K0V04_15075 [Deltaproteobacteria bacterium]|nr:hypothetical protein [Deltaproteobacteria bacterium]